MPKFSGDSSWDQYRQVFDAIVRSNGWDDAAVALQLLSHLEGDALNVALLVPEVKRATRAGLVGELTEHYGSPGWLADYRLQFERTTRQEGEDPSTFAIALETLVLKAKRDVVRKNGPLCDSHKSVDLDRYPILTKQISGIVLGPGYISCQRIRTIGPAV